MRKLHFTIASVSSEDEAFPSTELAKQIVMSRGWQSSKRSTYPQVLVLQFGVPVLLGNIQILAHECKIPSKIDVSISVSEVEAVLENVSFRYAGYMAFEHNRDGKFKSGELRVAVLNERCTWVKLVLWEPHLNKLNFNNQVGLYSISCLGEYAEGAESQGEALLKDRRDPLQQQPSPLDALMIDLRYDGAVLARILDLQKQKQMAADHEDFLFARRLKDQIDQLVPLAERIMQIEVRKRQALLDEDFQTAQVLKAEAEQLRFKAINLRAGVAFGDFNEVPISLPNAQVTSATVAYPPKPIGTETILTPSVAATTTLQTSEKTLSMNAMSAIDKAMSEKIQAECATAHVDPPDDVRGEMASVPHFGELLSALGVYTTCCLFSKKFQLRQAAFKCLKENANEILVHCSPEDVLDAILTALESHATGLTDSVNGVFIAAAEALEAALEGRFNGSSASVLRRHASSLTTAVLSKLGDANQRVRTKVSDLISLLAASPSVGRQIVFSALLNGRHSSSFRVWLARLDAVLSMLKPPDGVLGDNDLSVLLPFITKALNHQHASVRDKGLDILAWLVLNKPGSPEVKSFVSALKPLLKAGLDSKTGGQKTEETEPEPEDFLGPRPVSLKQQAPDAESMRSGADREARKLGTRPEIESPKKAGPRVDPSAAAAATRASPRVEKPINDLPTRPPRRAPLPPRPGQCQFCDLSDKSFEDHNDLVQHFISECPMLCSCPLCQLPVEIRDVHWHMVEDCENRWRVEQCPRCFEAVRKDDLENHIKDGRCISYDPQYILCPLCKTRLPNSDVFWRTHIMVSPFCAGNPRTSIIPE